MRSETAEDRLKEMVVSIVEDMAMSTKTMDWREARGHLAGMGLTVMSMCCGEMPLSEHQAELAAAAEEKATNRADLQ